MEPVHSQPLILPHVGPEHLQQLITEVVQRSLSGWVPSATSVPSVVACPSVDPDSEDQDDDCLSLMVPDSPLNSYYNDHSVMEAFVFGEPGLSEDEGLPPDQPAFSSLFPQALFKPLPFKAINTAQLGSVSAQHAVPSGQGSLDPLFAGKQWRPFVSLCQGDLLYPYTAFFLEVLKKQWASPGSDPVPSATD